MSGHNKWSKIKNKKGEADAKRGAVFNKLSREIFVAAKAGGGDPAMNASLRMVLDKARAANMPKDNIERAMAKAQANDTANYEEVRYEGYGPGGIAIIVEALSDNRNRTASEIRSAFSKLGGNLGETGSVAFSFTRIGVLRYDKSVAHYEKMLEYALDTGADNVEEFDDIVQITSSVELFATVRDAFTKKFGDPSEACLVYVPNMTMQCPEDSKNTLMKLLDALEDNDDVQHVYTNLDD